MCITPSGYFECDLNTPSGASGVSIPAGVGRLPKFQKAQLPGCFKGHLPAARSNYHLICQNLLPPHAVLRVGTVGTYRISLASRSRNLCFPILAHERGRLQHRAAPFHQKGAWSTVEPGPRGCRPKLTDSCGCPSREHAVPRRHRNRCDQTLDRRTQRDREVPRHWSQWRRSALHRWPLPTAC